MSECAGTAAGLPRVICNLFTPSVGFGDRLDSLKAVINGKFPFSLADALTAPSPDALGGSHSLGLPETIGIIQLNVPALMSFVGIVRPAMTVVLGVWLLWWLIDRYTPQAVI